MRWDELFEDLAGQADHAHRMDLAGEVADRIRREEATVALADRLRAVRAGDPADPGERVTFVLRDGSRVVGGVVAAGPGWLLTRESATGRQVLLPDRALSAVLGAPRTSAAPQGTVAARRTLVLAVRALADAGEPVLVRTVGIDVRGRIGRVGADHLDVAVEGPTATARDVVTVPFAAVLCISEHL